MEENNNILSWYKFKENASILIVGTDFVTLTDFLKNKFDDFININNDIDEIKNVNKKFDYIVLFDLNKIIDVKDKLKEDGIILLIVDNKFSISFFAGSKPQKGNIFDTILHDDSYTFSKTEIEKNLKQNGFDYMFYYPFPNYRMSNVIFSDRYIPNENSTKLMYNISYLKGSAVVFDELKALKQLTKDGQFANFANSFLVVINDKNIKKQARFISFNNLRKNKYKLMTKIYDDYVEKTICSEEAKEHLENIASNCNKLQALGFNVIDEKRENVIYSRYMSGQTLDKQIIEYILSNNKEKAFNMIEEFYNYIKEKLVLKEKLQINSIFEIEDNSLIDNLQIIKNGYIDIVFENTFFENGNYFLFDQEWYVEDIPVEYIFYRAITNLYIYNQEINSIISYEQMLLYFNLLPYVEIFKKIETYIQNTIIDDNTKIINEQSIQRLVDINKVAIMESQIEDFKNNDIKQDEYIKRLEEENKDLKKDNRLKDEYIKSLESKKIRNRFKKFKKME